MWNLILFPSWNEIPNKNYFSMELLRLESEKEWDKLSDLVNDLYNRDMIEIWERWYPIYVWLEKNQTFIQGIQFNEEKWIFEVVSTPKEKTRESILKIVT